MATDSDVIREELCRNSSAGSTDRSILTSSPDFLSPHHDRRHFCSQPLLGEKTRSKSLVVPPVSARLSIEENDDDTLCPDGHRLSCPYYRGRRGDASSRTPRLRRARSVSVLVGPNGQVWTQAGDERCPVPMGRQQTAVSLAMDERVIATITQHYYPEGGWGWWICLCAFLVQFLLGGLQGGCGLLIGPITRRYGTSPMASVTYEATVGGLLGAPVNAVHSERCYFNGHCSTA
ncbi:hypothetical protein HPB51_015334 [Rhipicephalus microplus]|uniref:Monocarboxylate transporter n=1 Tax=Rhipicephalus microplus TaxID=6941 RepID=A0A9J6DHD4_RHIMP|nr:hypothetical protein HPB51_015334 [Rhipicephalus microplus]